eukprot:gb/GECH01010651.1/.p1 GENE.gb/GECH01010651.1/~~gb/GECH01010651.1/.p1  ORF type:complete len:137 (+),score=24.93 gb/GECH01010651.1/:1-411(+)
MNQNTLLYCLTSGVIAAGATTAAFFFYSNKTSNKPIEKHAIQKFSNDGKAGIMYRGSRINLVRKILSSQGTIAAHSHPGKQIVLTLIKGAVDVQHGGLTETLTTPGDIVTFFGDEKVSMKAGDDGAEFIVCLNALQ